MYTARLFFIGVMIFITFGCGKNSGETLSPAPQLTSASDSTQDNRIDGTLLAYQTIFNQIERDLKENNGALTAQQYREHNKNLQDMKVDSLLLMEELRSLASQSGGTEYFDKYEKSIRHNERASIFIEKNLLPKPTP
jgi:hypothetical protein